MMMFSLERPAIGPSNSNNATRVPPAGLTEIRASSGYGGNGCRSESAAPARPADQITQVAHQQNQRLAAKA
ncbi:MAG: hypothetical protein U0174_24680 [Polyangiaceae bacterium]